MVKCILEECIELSVSEQHSDTRNVYHTFHIPLVEGSSYVRDREKPLRIGRCGL